MLPFVVFPLTQIWSAALGSPGVTSHGLFVNANVHVAYDGKAAIESVQRLKPDAVLLDIGLPTFDGYLVAEHIRAQPDNLKTMIVAVSGYGQEQDRERSKSVGFDYHVVKPIDPAVLASLVGSLRLLREESRVDALAVPAAGART